MNAARLRLRLLGIAALALGVWSAWLVVRPSGVVEPDVPRARAPQRAAAARGVLDSSRDLSRGAIPEPSQASPMRITMTLTALRNPFETLPSANQRDAPTAVALAAPPAAVAAPAQLAEAPAPPVPATEPPPRLPYKFIGMYAEKSDAPSVFLALGERLIIARSGQIVEGGFRLDAVTPSELTFVHVQQNVMLRLSVDGGSP